MGGEHLIDALDSLGSPGPPATSRATDTACSSLLRVGTFSCLKIMHKPLSTSPPGHWTNDEGYVITWLGKLGLPREERDHIPEALRDLAKMDEQEWGLWDQKEWVWARWC